MNANIYKYTKKNISYNINFQQTYNKKKKKRFNIHNMASIAEQEKTKLGLARYLKTREDGVRELELSWELANNSKAILYTKRQNTKRINGKQISIAIKDEVANGVNELKESINVVPGLGTILVGQRQDSALYVRMKNKAADKVGFYHVNINLEDTISEDALMEEVNKLNNDDRIHGILVQLPLPKHIDAEKILRNIKVSKDADGFSALNIGNMCLRGGLEPMAIPCTPAGCIELLKRSNIEVSGKNAVVLGRSNIVGMPVAHLLQQMNATVTVCHSRTKNPQQFIKQADIIVAAIGKAEYVRGDWLKPGCVVIDVGINSVPDATKKRGTRLCGDVNWKEIQGVASHATPVPGGCGPMTIAMLLKNTLNLARLANGLEKM